MGLVEIKDIPFKILHKPTLRTTNLKIERLSNNININLRIGIIKKESPGLFVDRAI